MSTSSAGRSTGSGRKRMALTTLKIDALTPMPRARVRSATRVKAGDRRSPRIAYRTSWISVSILALGVPEIGMPNLTGLRDDGFAHPRSHQREAVFGPLLCGFQAPTKWFFGLVGRT